MSRANAFKQSFSEKKLLVIKGGQSSSCCPLLNKYTQVYRHPPEQLRSLGSFPKVGQRRTTTARPITTLMLKLAALYAEQKVCFIEMHSSEMVQ